MRFCGEGNPHLFYLDINFLDWTEIATEKLLINERINILDVFCYLVMTFINGVWLYA